jgi:hypothetical protein
MSQTPPTTPPDAPKQDAPKAKDTSKRGVDGEAYPGHFGGYNGSEPRELSERTDEERDLIDNQGHTIADAIRIAGNDNALAR